MGSVAAGKGLLARSNVVTGRRRESSTGTGNGNCWRLLWPSSGQRSFALFHQLIVYQGLFLAGIGPKSTSPIGPLPPLQRFTPILSFAGFVVTNRRSGHSLEGYRRTGQLQVKQFDHTITADTLLALNLDAGNTLWIPGSPIANWPQTRPPWPIIWAAGPAYTFLLNSSLPGSPRIGCGSLGQGAKPSNGNLRIVGPMCS